MDTQHEGYEERGRNKREVGEEASPPHFVLAQPASGGGTLPIHLPARRCFLSVPAQSTSLVQMPSELDLLAVKRRAICLYYATAVGFVIFICALNVQTNEWLNKSFTFLFFIQPLSLSLSHVSLQTLSVFLASTSLFCSLESLCLTFFFKQICLIFISFLLVSCIQN